MSNLDLPGIALGFMREEFVHDLDRADVGRTLAKSLAGIQYSRCRELPVVWTYCCRKPSRHKTG